MAVVQVNATRTNIDGLDLDAFLDMCGIRAIRDLVGQHLRLTERIDECGATRARCTCITSTRNETWKPIIDAVHSGDIMDAQR